MTIKELNEKLKGVVAPTDGLEFFAFFKRGVTFNGVYRGLIEIYAQSDDYINLLLTVHNEIGYENYIEFKSELISLNGVSWFAQILQVLDEYLNGDTK